MKMTIFTMGSHGDIRPYVALALELKMRGHTVCMATDKRDEQFCKNANLEFAPLSGDLINSSFLYDLILAKQLWDVSERLVC